MSAQPCGCDPEEGYMCRVHVEENQVAFDAWVKARSSREAALARITETLATFYRAPISMSSVQPILDLAVELNPSLKETK